MATFIPFDRMQAPPLASDLKDWLPRDDQVHFIVAAVGLVALSAFNVNRQPGSSAAVSPATDAGVADQQLCQWHFLVASH